MLVAASYRYSGFKLVAFSLIERNEWEKSLGFFVITKFIIRPSE
ncbi:hypothetical protein A964_0648 [Streptococcus agalactiae GD201008-001]|nr:hypothetical protein A964_0648 [Streptococcus agalactiae GD201008-001]